MSVPSIVTRRASNPGSREPDEPNSMSSYEVEQATVHDSVRPTAWSVMILSFCQGLEFAVYHSLGEYTMLDTGLSTPMLSQHQGVLHL